VAGLRHRFSTVRRVCSVVYVVACPAIQLSPSFLAAGIFTPAAVVAGQRHAEKVKAAVLGARLVDVEEGCQLLTLPHGDDGQPVEWPGISSNVLFVRPLFRHFYDVVLQRFGPEVRNLDKHKLLRGVPGIGKSSFGL
jgi:hypothetical protein